VVVMSRCMASTASWAWGGRRAKRSAALPALLAAWPGRPGLDLPDFAIFRRILDDVLQQLGVVA